MQRILVLRGGALGDFIVTLPSLALLHERWPTAQLDFVGNATAAVLGVRAGLIDRAESQHDAPWQALYAAAPLPAALRDRLNGYDLVLSFWPDPDRTLAAHFPSRPGQTFLSAAALPSIAPAAAHYCQPLAALGLTPKALHYTLATHRPDPVLVALHPGSGSPRKNWPLDRWHALANWLQQTHDLTPCIVSGEAEPPAVRALPGQHWTNLPLPELTDRLARCRLFIGHDSGISHLAAATGTPSRLLFGPTDPAVWAPPQPHVQVLHASTDLASLTLAAVQKALDPLLTSVPASSTNPVSKARARSTPPHQARL